MAQKLIPDTEACKTCTVGSCCYEGAELTPREVRRIIQYNPKVSKPWFRLVESHEEPEKHYPLSTIMRNGTCVFQDKNNLCMVYKVRPKHCRDFPVEDGEAAPYYKHLCVLFQEEWHGNSEIKRKLKQREKM